MSLTGLCSEHLVLAGGAVLGEVWNLLDMEPSWEMGWGGTEGKLEGSRLIPLLISVLCFLIHGDVKSPAECPYLWILSCLHSHDGWTLTEAQQTSSVSSLCQDEGQSDLT